MISRILKKTNAFNSKNFLATFVNFHPNYMRTPFVAQNYSFSTENRNQQEDIQNDPSKEGKISVASKIKQLEEQIKDRESSMKATNEELSDIREKFNKVKKAYLEKTEEYDLYVGRTKKEVDNAKVFSISKFAKEILDVHDNFSRALATVEKIDFKHFTQDEKTRSFEQLLEGVEITKDGLETTMRRFGIVEYIPIGEKFDSNFHDAVFNHIDDQAEANTVCHVAQSGFMINERVLRAAKVGVVKHNK